MSRGRGSPPHRDQAAGGQDADRPASGLGRLLKEVFAEIGGRGRIAQWASEHPSAFYALLARETGGPQDAGPQVIALLADRPLTQEEWLNEIEQAKEKQAQTSQW